MSIFPSAPRFSPPLEDAGPVREWVMPAVVPRFGQVKACVALPPGMPDCLEPEAVFGMKATPKAGADIDDLFDAIDWVAPGFEVVQSHLPGWKFTAADTVADSPLHARLLVGRRMPVRELASSAADLDRMLAHAKWNCSKRTSSSKGAMAPTCWTARCARCCIFLSNCAAARGQPTCRQAMS